MKKQDYSNLPILIAAILFFISCHENKPASDRSTVSNYSILTTEPYESSQKAQVSSYVYLTTDTTSKENLTTILTNVYLDLKYYSKFKNHYSPTVIAIYLYTSKDRASNMRESWVAMLSKTPSNIQPEIQFDEQKLRALLDQGNGEKSDDEKRLDELNNYFNERKTSLCSIYKALYDIEGATIEEADKKYPDFGIKHSDYQRNRYKEEKAKLFKKYNISDTVSSEIAVFGMNYCK